VSFKLTTTAAGYTASEVLTLSFTPEASAHHE
jgi:hypothetical protein